MYNEYEYPSLFGVRWQRIVAWLLTALLLPGSILLLWLLLPETFGPPLKEHWRLGLAAYAITVAGIFSYRTSAPSQRRPRIALWLAALFLIVALPVLKQLDKNQGTKPLKHLSGACTKDMRSPYDGGCPIPTGFYRRIHVPARAWSDAFCLYTSPAPRLQFAFEGCGAQRYRFHYVDDGPHPERQITASTAEHITLDRQVMCGHFSMTERPCDVVVEAHP